MRLLFRLSAPVCLLASHVSALEPEIPSSLETANRPPTREELVNEYRNLTRSFSTNSQPAFTPQRTDNTRDLDTQRWQRHRTAQPSSFTRNRQPEETRPLSAAAMAMRPDQALLAQSAGRSPAPVHGGFGGYQYLTSHAAPNLSIGPLDVALTWTGGLESSDNFFHTQHDRHESLSLTAGMIADAEWHLTESQSISLTIGTGIDYWLDGPDGTAETGDIDINVAPGSLIDYIVEIGETISLRLYNQFQIQHNRQRNQFSLDGVTVSDRWINASGAELSWMLNDMMLLEASYEFGKRHSLESQFAGFDYDWQSTGLALTITDGAAFSGGISTQASWSDYDSPTRNDAKSLALGAFVNWAPSDYTTVFATAGFEQWRFSDSTTTPSDRHGNFYGSLGISNDLNEDFRHTLSVGRQSSLSDFSDLSQTNFVRYGMDWNVLDGTRINAYAAYHHSKELGGGRSEKIDALKLGLNVRQTLTDYLTLGMGTHYNDYDSNLPGRTYSELRGQVWLTWRMNESVNLTTSYEHWRAAKDVKFQENRFMVNASVSF